MKHNYKNASKSLVNKQEKKPPQVINLFNMLDEANCYLIWTSQLHGSEEYLSTNSNFN